MDIMLLPVYINKKVCFWYKLELTLPPFAEVILMSTHKIYFYEELTKDYPSIIIRNTSHLVNWLK